MFDLGQKQHILKCNTGLFSIMPTFEEGLEVRAGVRGGRLLKKTKQKQNKTKQRIVLKYVL